jgi:hypothetical protein
VGRRDTSVARKGAKPEDSITPQQYQTGWELVSTGHTVQQVIAATGLTRPQLAWLTKVGSESRGMPSYYKRLAEQVARIRSRGQEAADHVGAGAVDAVKRSVEITAIAQTTARNILASHYKQRVQPAVAKIQAGTGSEKDLAAMTMPHSLRETLKVLKHYANFSETAHAFRLVFESPHQNRDPLTEMPKEARIDLSGEALLPAATALVEELGGEAEVGHDLLDDLLPEYRGWTDEEIDSFLETGERPSRDFGGVSSPVIDVNPIGDENDEGTEGSVPE